MKKFTTLIFGVFFYISIFADAISYADCGSSNVLVLSIDLTPCGREPCTVYKGRLATIYIDFVAFERLDVGGVVIQGTFTGGRRLIPLPRNGGCAPLAPQCTIAAGETQNYFFTGTVPNELQRGHMTVRWELLDSRGAMFVCVEFPVIVAETTH
ncbi:hypothetical protein CRM22_003758 [Opisthorchis felineus]|uniref:MD-2-related lipid-recognition domain-containing protein n=1 Tax=Opisthorchis felineus TaxID=147828 RepID=A0A4S2M4R1_OPIFE|nr:hypothetical protein CRM22_003758 [Opisthorchis felineus]